MSGIELADLSRSFHEAYERLAPSFGYETRPESAKPWEQVPEQNRRLMTAVCAEMLTLVTRSQSERERRLEEALKDLVAFVSVMCGSGEEAVIPETVATPLGVQVKIGAMMRDARSALNQEGGSNVG